MNMTNAPLPTNFIQNIINEDLQANKEYRHIEGNSDAHLKASLLGSSQLILIENGSLVLGTWQGIYLAEFDGPRTRTIVINIIKTTSEVN